MRLFQFGKIIEKLNNNEETTNKVSIIPKNFRHCVLDSQKEQDLNKCRAMVRLRDTKTGKSMKHRIENLFFKIDEWPLFILKILLGINEFDHANRLAMAAFFHGNGFKDKDKAENIFLFYYRKFDWSRKWKQRMYQFRSLFDWLENAYDRNSSQYHNIRENYYYFNMRAKQTMYYDGSIRGRKGEKIEYIAY